VALVHETPYEGEVLTLEFEDGTSLEVTEDHPIWVIEGHGLASRPQLHFRDACEDSGLSLPGRWVHSQALRVGDQLYGRDGAQVRIRTILSRQDSLPVYNLSVLGLPYYAVGSVGVVVHNTESVPGSVQAQTRRVFTATNEAVDLSRQGTGATNAQSGTLTSRGAGGTFVTETDLTNPSALEIHVRSNVPPGGEPPSFVSEIEVPARGLLPDPTEGARPGNWWIAPDTPGAKVVNSWEVQWVPDPRGFEVPVLVPVTPG
jgi:hypothetical protein